VSLHEVSLGFLFKVETTAYIRTLKNIAMALIGKIREKSALLLLFVGGALLIFVVLGLGDPQSNPFVKLFKSLTGQQVKEYGYGTVYDTQVDPMKFNEAVTRFQEQDAMQAQQQQREYTQKDQETSIDKAWNYMVETTIFDKEFEALGIDVSESEFDAYLYGTDGFSVLPELAQGFTDSLTGTFNAKLLEKRINEMESSTDANVQKQWADNKKYYTDRRKQEKYMELIGQGLFVTKLEAEEEYFAQKEVKSISYVVRRYSELMDDDIKVSDEELKAYYEEHKNDKKYENKTASREVRYFDVTIAPSRSDSSKFNRLMNGLKTEFAKTTSDSLFVLKNSEMKFYSSQKIATAVPEGNEKAQKLQSYPKNLDTIFKTATLGQIVGPYESRGNFVISKVIGFTPSRLKARHILLSTNQSTDAKVIAQKQKMADSLLKIINKDNFAEYVTKFSDDPGSKQNGGEYDNFLEADMVPEFGAFCATKPVGTIGTVKTQFGIHIIEVLERDAAKFPVLASVAKVFKASQETIDRKESEVYNLLYKIEAKISRVSEIKKKLELFDTIAQQAGYFVRPISMQDEAPKLYGFNTAPAENKILELAYSEDAEVGTITSSPIKDKDRYIIAILSSVKEKGVPLFEDIEVTMKRDLIEEKKAKRFTNQLLKDKSLPAMAKRANAEVMKAEVTFGNPQITGAGYEPEVIGSLFSGLKDGQRTLPLKGKMGVYVIRIDKTTKAPTAASYTTERDQLLSALKGGLQGQVISALKKKAEVIDNRKLYNAGIRR
jgi:peptidyl-prolyl cis-trans isomerase D